MATAKPAKTADTKPDEKTTAAPTTDAKDSKDSQPSYGEQAADLAAHAQKLTDDLAEALDDLTDHHGRVQQTAPDAAELQAADAVRRLPMAFEEVRRAVVALRQAATDLAQRTQ
jgi:hypothetical protein